MTTPSGLVRSLSQALEILQQNPQPYVPNPPDCQKRASVALILRIRPSYADGIQNEEPISGRYFNAKADVQVGGDEEEEEEKEKEERGPAALERFFAQSWVQNGDPEMLFIKRAGREGDRWSGHVALPGGGRDPQDEDDAAVAVRETREEIGLDLTDGSCLLAGNLAERVVTTTWGKTALLVLCPFVFVLTTPTPPTPLLQPSEIAAAHWVPLRCLLSSSLRTHELVDVSSRLAKRAGPLAHTLLRLTLGQMTFSAIRLTPSESHFSPSSLHHTSPDNDPTSPPPPHKPNPSNPPLNLWGLTLGILSDVLDLLPPHTASGLWHYPTFTPPDLRLLIHIFTYRIRRGTSINARQLSTGSDSSNIAISNSNQPTPESAAAVDSTSLSPSKAEQPKNANAKPRTTALSTYYDRMNIAVAVFLLWRTALLGAGVGCAWYWYWYYRRHSVFWGGWKGRGKG